MATPNLLLSMRGCRDAVSHGLTHIEFQIDAIESAISENPGLCFDLSRTIIESTCRTIIKERGASYSESDDLPKLFKDAARLVPHLPPTVTNGEKADDALKKTINGLHTAIQGICELRNHCGFASHGSDGTRPILEQSQALLAAQTADAIVGYLYEAHKAYVGRLEQRKNELKFEDNEEFNQFVDESYGPIIIFKEDLDASKVLFELAREPYRISLAEFEQNKFNATGEEE